MQALVISATTDVASNRLIGTPVGITSLLWLNEVELTADWFVDEGGFMEGVLENG